MKQKPGTVGRKDVIVAVNRGGGRIKIVIVFVI
jgi:hypothetical protein